MGDLVDTFGFHGLDPDSSVDRHDYTLCPT